MDHLTNELNQLRKSARIMYALFGLGLLAGIIMLLSGKIKPGYFLIILMLILYFFAVSPHMRRLNHMWRKERLRRCADASLRQVVFRDAPDSCAGQLRASVFLPINTVKSPTIAIRNYLMADNGRQELMDVTFPMNLLLRGKLRVSWVSGALIRIAISPVSGRNIRLVSGQLLPGSSWLTFYTENGLNMREISPDPLCRLLCLSEQNSTYEIPQGAIKKINRLCDSTPGTVLMAIDENTLQVFIAHRLLSSGQVNLKREITEAELQSDCFPELSLIMDIANKFSLGHM